MFAAPTVAVRAALAPLEGRARQVLAQALISLLRTMLVSRLVVHALIVWHLAWLAHRLAVPGDAFHLDVRQYAWFLARGGEDAWARVMGVGAFLGLIGLCVSYRLARVIGAACMGTVEFVIAHGLTASHAAPTGEPTYGTFVIMCSWLIIVHCLPDRKPGFDP